MRLKDLSIIQYQNISRAYHVDELWLPIDAFRKQLDHFSKKDFNVLSMDEAIEYMEGKIVVRKTRPISLTFDNGFFDFYEFAYPLLSEYKFPCTLLISPLKVGHRVKIGDRIIDYLTWDNLRELMNNKITIGAYDDYKRNINSIPEDLVRRHIFEFKKIMEDKLGSRVRYFGIKEGVPNQNIRDLLIKAGYRAFLTECPTNRKPDLYSIGRIQVDDDDFNIFLTKVSRTYLFFKDKKSWKYIRKYQLDRFVHRLSEILDRLRGIKTL